MAKLVYEVKPHWCHRELVEFNSAAVGSIAQCSCGKYHKMIDTQIDGKSWAEIAPEEARPFLKSSR